MPDRELIKDRIKFLKSRQEQLILKTNKIPEKIMHSACYSNNISNEKPEIKQNLFTNGKFDQKITTRKKDGKTRVFSINHYNPQEQKELKLCEKSSKYRACLTHRDKTPEILGDLENPSSEEKENKTQNYFNMPLNACDSKKSFKEFSMDEFLTQRYMPNLLN